MMQEKYLRPGFDFALAHAIEEAGEFLAAAGKTLRWGRNSVNPELPTDQQETNEEWLAREMADLHGALGRLALEAAKTADRETSANADELYHARFGDHLPTALAKEKRG